MNKELCRKLIEIGYPQPPYLVGARWWGRWDNSPLYTIIGEAADGFIFQCSSHTERGVKQEDNFLIYCPDPGEALEWLKHKTAKK